MQLHLVLDCATRDILVSLRVTKLRLTRRKSHKLIDPRWIGMNGALATKSPSGANKAQEKSNLSLMFVLMEVCWRERPIASATLMKRLAKRVSKIGSGPFVELLEESTLGIVGSCRWEPPGTKCHFRFEFRWKQPWW
jgi:hypothetical protein